MRSNILTAIDIGSGGVKGLVGEKNQNGIEVLALAQGSCLGIRNGEVVSPEQVRQSILQVKDDLSKSAGIKIREAVFNIGGTHLFSVHSQGLVSVARADRTITKEDINRVLKEAEVINLQSNKEVLEVFPKGFIVDGETGIKDPLNLKGIRLEAEVLLACVFSPVLTNLEKAINLSGLNYSDIFITPLAVSSAVLSQEQKELGVLVLDIGFSVTSLAVFDKGELIDFAVLPLGSSHITNDLAIGLRTEIQVAESIKQEFGTLKLGAKKSSVDTIKITEKDIECSKTFLKNVIESRVNEIFFEAQKMLKKMIGQNQLPCGLVLTGGGSLLPGIVDFAKQKCKLPCRLGEIRAVKGIEDPKFTTAAGLLALSFSNLENGTGEKNHQGNFGKKIKRVFKAFLP
ncbi:MAG: cell division protein FtsA [Candidatus Pacebacteria bacterium]|nr:cell division protein FtsA [Candidatus Paceibacterota bacterium]